MFALNKINREKLRKYYIHPITEGFVLALVAMVLSSITAYFIYFHAMKIISIEIRDGLLRTVSGIASCLDTDKIGSFNSPTQKNDEDYLKMLKLLQKARLATKDCTYIYVNRMVNGKVYFILDPTPIDASGTPIFKDAKNTEASVPMTEYPDASKELILSLKKQIPVVSSVPYTDEWGTFYSAYVPLYNKRGVCVGTLGADLQINEMLARLEPMKDATKRAFFVAFILAMLMGTIVWFSRRFAGQLNESRYRIHNELNHTMKFASKSYTVIGKQLRRMSNIVNAFINKLKDSLDKDPIDEKGIRDNIEIFSGFLKKVDEIGSIKLKESLEEESNFYFADIQKRLLKECSNDERLVFKISKDIPEKVNGDVNLYFKISRRIIDFYLKTFKGKVKIEFELHEEEIDSLSVLNKFSATFDVDNESIKSLLKKITSEIEQEEFFDDFAVIEAADLSVARELIYMMNSGFNMTIVDDTFNLAFEANLNKYEEELETEEDSPGNNE